MSVFIYSYTDVSLTLPTSLSSLFQHDYILPWYRPKQLYSLSNKSNSYRRTSHIYWFHPMSPKDWRQYDMLRISQMTESATVYYFGSTFIGELEVWYIFLIMDICVPTQICLNECACIYVHAQIHTNLCTNTCMHVCFYMYVCVFMHVCACVYMFMCTHVCLKMCVFAYKTVTYFHLCISTNILYTHLILANCIHSQVSRSIYLEQ